MGLVVTLSHEFVSQLVSANRDIFSLAEALQPELLEELSSLEEGLLTGWKIQEEDLPKT